MLENAHIQLINYNEHSFHFFMQYLSFKLIVYEEIGLNKNCVFVSDIMIANEKSRNQVELKFIVWVQAAECHKE